MRAVLLAFLLGFAAATTAPSQDFGEVEEAWFRAARCGETQELLALLGEVPIDLQDCEGNTALMLAVKAGHLDSVAFLAQRGADVGKAANRGATPLGYAVFRGDPEMVRALLIRGEDVDVRGQRDSTPLMRASRAGRADLVKILLEAGARVDERNRDGLTPLMLASGEGRTEVVQLLLRHGAEPTLKTPTGLSALDFANINKQAGPARILKATLSERARKGGAPQPPPAAP